MNDDATTLDQADEDILTYEVSDEALEAGAGPVRGARATSQLTLVVSAGWCCCGVR
jgi:hypothetical protein